MTLPSIAAGGVAKALIAVTVSLHPAPAHHGGHYVTVRPGDTLSSISKREYGRAADWPALWWINRHRAPDPAMIRVGSAAPPVGLASAAAVAHPSRADRDPGTAACRGPGGAAGAVRRGRAGFRAARGD